MQALYKAEDIDSFKKLADILNGLYSDYSYIGDHRIAAEGSLLDHVKAENTLRKSDIPHKFRLI